MAGYSKGKVVELTGLSARRVQFYTEEGLVKPGHDAGEGRGSVRRYSKRNLFEFALIRQLTAYGMTLQTLRDVFGLLTAPNPGESDAGGFPRWIDRRGIMGDWETLTNAYLLLSPRQGKGWHPEVLRNPTDEWLVREVKQHATVLTLDIGRIVRDIRDQ